MIGPFSPIPTGAHSPAHARWRAGFCKGCVLPGLVLVAAAAHCGRDLSINSTNQLPIADARIIRNGQSVDGLGDGGAALLAFPFSGTPVSITLDASHSSDPDGTITAYRWMSGTPAPEGGAELPDEGGVEHRWIPPGAPVNWPGTGVRPQVQLGEGSWSQVRPR